jgi:hypothetical protein
VLEQPAEEREEQALLGEQHGRRDEDEALHAGPGHRGHGAGGTLLDQGVRAKGLGRPDSESGEDDVVPRQRSRQLVDAAGISLPDLQPRMLACDLRWRPHERRDLMAAGQCEVQQLRSRLSVGTEDEQFHFVPPIGLTGQEVET